MRAEDGNGHEQSSPDVWKGERLVASYLTSVRGGIPYGADQIEVALRVASAWQPHPRQILDLGCGDGIVGAAARHLWPDAQLTLLDFSPAMLTAARERFSRGLPVRYIEADFGDPVWVAALEPGSRFDLILSAYAIHHQEDDRKRALYGELFDLLQPGGVFVNIEHVASVTPAVAVINDSLFVDTIERHQRSLGSTDSRDDIARRYYYRPDKAANRLAPVERQLGWLRDIGFADVDCYFKVLELAVFGGRKPA
jgi:ubiquinone/menaquinone biosynthesis C-methylase UbiE